VPIAPAPPWVIARLKKQGERAELIGESIVELDQSHNIQRARDFLRNRAPAIEGESGDAHTLATASHLGDLGISEALAFDLMAELFNPRCEPAWDDSELTKKVENAYRYRERPLGCKASDSAALDEAMARAEALRRDETKGSDSETIVTPAESERDEKRERRRVQFHLRSEAEQDNRPPRRSVTL
jgi:hypothetical protein